MLKKRILRSGIITLVSAMTVATLTAQRSHDAAVARNLEIFNSIVQELELNYVDSIRTDKSFRSAIDAMLSEIDPYTEYFDDEESKNFSTVTTGEYAGIGSYLLDRDGKTYISSPYENSPAQRAGLRAGDHLLRVDSVDVSHSTSVVVSPLLRGQAGTPVTITVARPFEQDSIRVFTLEREKLQLPSVTYYGVLGDSTGYIMLNSFIDKSAQEVKDALESFMKNPNVKNVVLDLRGNGGGLLEAAVEILGYFVPKGTEVLRTRGQEIGQEKIYKTTRKPLLPDMPLAVLINGNSASASEILAGAVQDLDRGVLLGKRSFGKGLVQSTRPIPYDGMLKVTVAKYYIPSGRLIQALDYSHRNPDGSVARTPDSLTNVYRTLHGREVRDGGGLTPDVVVDNNTEVTSLTYTLYSDNWLFDYANKFASEHKKIAPPGEFVLADSTFVDFKHFIDPSRIKTDRPTDKMLDDLREAARAEGYLTDSVASQMDLLKTMLNRDVYDDIEINRAQITRYLEPEIVSRYYYNSGEVRQILNYDDVVKSAMKILNDPAEYKKILSAPKSSRKKRR